MSSIFWLSDSFRKHLAQKVHDLENDIYKVALVTSSVACPETVWTDNTTYALGDVVIPTTRNGHRYICTVGGTVASGATEPTWPTTTGGTVGTAPAWAEYGGDLCAHSVWADFSDDEVTDGDGYTTGGVALTSKALNHVYRDVYWDADDVPWTSITKTFRYAVLYQYGINNSIVNGVVGYQLCDDTFVDRVLSAVDYKIQWSANGILKIFKG